MRSFWLLLLSLVVLPASRAQNPASQKPRPKAVTTAQTCGYMSNDLLKCSRFGFSYKVRFGWVDRTGDMQEDAEAGNQNEAAKSEMLLAAFERPPGAPGDSINSAVVIAAERLSDYRGIKTASDYFGPIAELAQQRGFKVVNEPYAFNVGTKQLVRGDFSKERGKLTMWQTSLVMIEKGYVVSFTFVGGSEDEVEELIGNLSFDTPMRRH